MVEVGFALSSEDHGPKELVRAAIAAEQAGFTSAWISDHYHPWNDTQGHSPFCWTVIGAIAQATDLRLGTGVTCPTVRYHPALVAQMAATSQILCDGRFFLGIGSGENLNEHIYGDPWPPTPIRLEMLEDAVRVIRMLWEGGEKTYYGPYYTVEDARVYDLPDQAPPMYMSAFGPKAIEVAARIADGYVGTTPDPQMLASFREQGGDKPLMAGTKCCWGDDEQEARRLAHERWPNMGLPGQLAQELRTPSIFEQANQLVPVDALSSIPCGPDPQPYVESIQQYADAGYTEVYIHNIGPDQEGFARFFEKEVRPQLK